MSKPPSNAFEVPLAQVSAVELTKCDGCNYYSTSTKHVYRLPEGERIPTVLSTAVRKSEIHLCLGCMFAYGRTLEGRGYLKINS